MRSWKKIIRRRLFRLLSNRLPHVIKCNFSQLKIDTNGLESIFARLGGFCCSFASAKHAISLQEYS